MPSHWTYDKDPCNDTSLNQGDYLYPTKELRQLLSRVFPTFNDAKYMGFIVVSQTCDLVLRNGKPKTDYISLAAVRPLRSILPRYFDSEGKMIADRIFCSSTRDNCKTFLERLFNQNEHGHGLFYLHTESALGIGDPSVAILRVSFALKSIDYKLLVDARKGRLLPEFQNKLGWIVGNLYSRAATRDWHEEDPDQLERMVSDALVGKLVNSAYEWVSDIAAEEAISEGLNLNELEHEIALKHIVRHQPPEFKDAVATMALDELKNALEGINKNPNNGIDISDDLVDLISEKFRNRIENSRALKKAIRRVLLEGV